MWLDMSVGGVKYDFGIVKSAVVNIVMSLSSILMIGWLGSPASQLYGSFIL